MTNVSLSLSLTRSPRHEETGTTTEYVETIIAIRDAVHIAALDHGATVVRCYLELESPTAAMLRGAFHVGTEDAAFRLASWVNEAARKIDAAHPRVLYSCHPHVTTDATSIDF